MEITQDIRYIGVNDHEVDLFEGQYVVPNGMAYNSYVVLDEKVTVFDTVDAHFTHQWLDNLENTLGGPTTLSSSTWSPTTPGASPPSCRPIRRPPSSPAGRPLP